MIAYIERALGSTLFHPGTDTFIVIHLVLHFSEL